MDTVKVLYLLVKADTVNHTHTYKTLWKIYRK